MASREELKAQAEELGLEFKGNISNADLAELIETSKDGISPEVKAAAEAVEAETKAMVEEVKEEKKEQVPQNIKTLGAVKAEARRNAEKKIRVIVTPMDKDKAELGGEIISCGNSMTGFLKEFVPFNKEWHVRSIIVDALKSKKHLTTKDRRTPKGIVKENLEIPAYTVNLLDDLTQDELDRLLKENK